MANNNKNMCGSGLLMMTLVLLLVILLFKTDSDEGYKKSKYGCEACAMMK